MQIGAAEFFTRDSGALAHAAFADDAADSEFLDKMSLVRFFADGGGGSGRDDFPTAMIIRDNDWSAVIKDSVAELDLGRESSAFVQIFMDDIASGEKSAADFDGIAHFEGADFFFGKRSGEVDHKFNSWIVQGLGGGGWVTRGSGSIEPFLNFAGGIERDALAAEGPAHIADADEIGGRKAMSRADFNAQQSGFTAEAHGADAQFVSGIEDVLFESVEFGIGIAIVEGAEELLFGKLVAAGAVAAQADPENAGAATFALSLEDGIEDDFAAAIEVAAGFEFFGRERILGADIFAAAAFENEADFDFGTVVLVEMEVGRADADVGAVVDAGEGVDGILAEATFFSGNFDGFFCGLFKRDLIQADGAADIKKNAAGVLADGLGFLAGEIDIALDDFESGLGDGPFFFFFEGGQDGLLDIVRDFRGSAAD